MHVAVESGAEDPVHFVSEDDLETFEGWSNYQGFDTRTAAPKELAEWRRAYEQMKERRAANPKVGRMRLRPDEHRHAVALREGSDLWLALWIRCSSKPEFFVFWPRAERDWNPHASYHLDGTLHTKSYDHKVLKPKKCQPLTASFRGTEHLGAYGGFGPKGVGAVCDPADFCGIVEVSPGVLGPRDGTVTVDLAEPGCQPAKDFLPLKLVQREIFRDTVPQVVITIWS